MLPQSSRQKNKPSVEKSGNNIVKVDQDWGCGWTNRRWWHWVVIDILREDVRRGEKVGNKKGGKERMNRSGNKRDENKMK
jgi:phosphatidylethanolamine-binding protein (PEBP) family uncharacterized protein